MRKVIFLVGFALIAGGVFGQESISLSFEEAVKIALEKNVDLNTQKNNLEVSEARRLQGYGNFLPTVNASSFGQRTEGLQINPITGEGKNITSDQIGASVNANYTIFNGLNRFNFLKQANAQLLAQSFLVERSKQDVIFNVASQYLTVLLDQELLRIAKENLEAQQVILNQIRGFVEVGTRAATDAYNQDADVQGLRVLMVRAKATLENDKALFAQTLQLDPADEYILDLPDWGTDISYYDGISLDSLYAIALANRPDLKQQQYQVDAFNYQKKASAGGYFPTLSLFAAYGSIYFSDYTISFEDQFLRNNPQLQYGVSLRVPIFNQFTTRLNRVTARASFENAILAQENLLRSIKIDVQRLYNNYLNAIEGYQASLTQFDAGQLALDMRQESYSLGIASQAELAVANQTFVQASASKAQAEMVLLFQKILIDYALGTLVIDDLIGN